MATGIKEVAKGRSDQYRLSPFDLHTKEGWNAREKDFDPNDEADIQLAQSIAAVGVKQPLTAYFEDGKVYLTDGHRRRAATIYAIENLGLDPEITVPVTPEPRNADEAERVASMIVRNSGKPLTPLEQAGVFARLRKLGWNDTQIGERAGVSRVYVANLISLVDEAPKGIANLVRSGAVSATLAVETISRHKGDGKAALKSLKEAVKVAKKAGKMRATAKHVRAVAEDKEPKVGLKERVRRLFELAEVIERVGEEAIVLKVAFTEFGAICEATGAQFALDDNQEGAETPPSSEESLI